MSDKGTDIFTDEEGNVWEIEWDFNRSTGGSPQFKTAGEPVTLEPTEGEE